MGVAQGSVGEATAYRDVGHWELMLIEIVGALLGAVVRCHGNNFETTDLAP
jgi:hypothetical protein